jgi:hypothetical protein
MLLFQPNVKEKSGQVNGLMIVKGTVGVAVD